MYLRLHLIAKPSSKILHERREMGIKTAHYQLARVLHYQYLRLKFRYEIGSLSNQPVAVIIFKMILGKSTRKASTRRTCYQDGRGILNIQLSYKSRGIYAPEICFYGL